MRHVALKDYKMNITAITDLLIFVNDEKMKNFTNKTALTIHLVKKCMIAQQFETSLREVVQIDDHKPAIYSASANTSLEEKLQRVEIFVENLK